MGPENFAFVSALLVNFIDTMGIQFTAPVVVPYGIWMGASLQTIALFATVRGIASMASTVWMPKLSDRRGRKLVVMMSLVGSIVAYTVQGLAGQFQKEGADFSRGSVIMFLVGRGLAGFFGGTNPVVKAYVTELSMPDVDLMRRRLTYMMLASQTAGIGLQPIAGAIATFGLQLPFYVCGGIGVFGLLWSMCFFKEVKALRAAEKKIDVQSDKTTAEKQKSSTESGEAEQEKPKRKNPYCDKVVIMMSLAFMSIVLVISGFQIILPLLLEEESFGLIGASTEETQANVAKALGLAAIPNSVCNIFTGLVLFVPMTKKFGDLKTILVVGVIVSLNIGSMGFLTSELWHLMINNAIMGMCFGFMMPALNPLMASYASAHYPGQVAEVQAIPMLAMNLSMSFGQNLQAFIMEQGGKKIGFVVCGTCTMIFVIFFTMSCKLVDKRTPKPDKLSKEQRKVMLQTGGEDADLFIDTSCEQLRHVLAKNKDKLWNRPIQFLVQQKIQGAVPDVREWNDSTHGEEYLQDIHYKLEKYPEELESFHAKFPHLRSNKRRRREANDFGMLDLDVEGGGDDVETRAKSRTPGESPASRPCAPSDTSVGSRSPSRYGQFQDIV